MDEPDLENRLAQLKGISTEQHREKQAERIVHEITKKAEQDDYSAKKEKKNLLKKFGILGKQGTVNKLGCFAKESAEKAELSGRCLDLSLKYKTLGQDIYRYSKSPHAIWGKTGGLVLDARRQQEFLQLNEEYRVIQNEVKPPRLIRGSK